MNKKSKAGNIVTNTILLLLALLFLLPYFWMIITSLKTVDQGPKFWQIWPEPITFRSYKEGFALAPFMSYIRNTAVIAVLCVTGTIISCTLTGFGFAKFNAKCKNLLFTLLLSTMMIPQTITLIPSYILYSKIGWINTILPLTLPAFFGISSFNIFLLRQYFTSLPGELAEAGLIDGCNWGQIFLRIYIPNTVPALLVVAINQIVYVWNDYLSPLVYLGKPKNQTIALGLNMFKGQHGGSIDPGPLMAMACITILPLFVLYIFFQKYFVEGITTSGIKG